MGKMKAFYLRNQLRDLMSINYPKVIECKKEKEKKKQKTSDILKFNAKQ